MLEQRPEPVTITESVRPPLVQTISEALMKAKSGRVTTLDDVR